MNNLFQNTDVTLQIVSFLSGNDTLRLHCVSQGFCCLLNTHSNSAFKTHLHADFLEGDRLVEAFQKRTDDDSSSSLSYKKIYKSFKNRWKLPPKKPGNERVVIPWQRTTQQNAQKDVDALVFIVRLWKYPNSCGFLKWEKNSYFDTFDNLTVDDEWYDNWYELGNRFELPDLDDDVCCWIDALCKDNDCDTWKRLYKDIGHNLYSTFRLTVHVIDTEACQIMTLLEDAPGGDVDDLRTNCPRIFGHAETVPWLYGSPHRGSPFYRHLTDADFQRMENQLDFLEYPHIESLCLSTTLDLCRITVERVCFEELNISPSPDESSICSRYHMCSYLRALMKRGIGYTTEGGDATASTLPQQPNVWIQAEKVLDNVITFIPFKEQAMTLRLVCKDFKAASLRMMQYKILNQTWLPIAFDRYDLTSWFRADARRGWSEVLTCRNDAIEEALWMVSCRCFHGSNCERRQDCPGTRETPFFRANGVTKELDMKQARRLLIEKGEFRLTPDFPNDQNDRKRRRNPSVQLSFDRVTGKNLCQLCQRVHKMVSKEVEYGILPSYLADPCGVSVEVSAERFLRMLFLVFTDGTCSIEGFFPAVDVAMAHVSFKAPNEPPCCRKRTMIRFHTASQEKVEIFLESKHVFDM